MRKIILALAVALIVLSGCNLSGVGGHKALAAIASGGGHYYLQSRTTATRAARDVSGGALYRVTDSGAIGAVTFYDTSGAALPVTVNHAVRLDGYLLASVTYNGETVGIAANTTTGALNAVSPIPEGWEFVRARDGKAYYIAASRLWRCELATGQAEAMSDPADGLDAAGWLVTLPGGGVIYTYREHLISWAPQVMTARYYPSTGGAGKIIDAICGYPPDSMMTGGGIVEESDGSVSIFRIGLGGATVTPIVITEQADGTPSCIQVAPVPLNYWPWPDNLSAAQWSRVSPSWSIGEGAVFASEYGSAKLTKASGSWSLDYVAKPADLPSYYTCPSYCGSTTADSGAIYHAYHEWGDMPNCDLTRYHLWRVPIASSASLARSVDLSTAGEIIVDLNVSNLVALGGKLFYQRDAGQGVQTMVYDTATGAASVYASGAVSIQPVE
jgi:hypothetical protein